MRLIHMVSVFAVAAPILAIAACSDNDTVTPAIDVDSGHVEKDATSSPADSAIDTTTDSGRDAVADADAGCEKEPSFGSEQCNTCVKTECAAKVTSCYNDCDCIAFDACLTACIPPAPTDGGMPPPPDQACIDKCNEDHPNSTTKLSDVQDCMYDKCSNETFTGPCD